MYWGLAAAAVAATALAVVAWGEWDRAPVLAVVLAMFIGAALMRPWLLDQLVARIEARTAGAVPVCAACGYEMTGLAPQGEGCVVCPECGAAWRFEKGLPTGGGSGRG